IWIPLTAGEVRAVYLEFKVPEPGGGKPMPVRLCGSVYGLLVVVTSATAWQSIHSAPSSWRHASRSCGQACWARTGNAASPMARRSAFCMRETSGGSLPDCLHDRRLRVAPAAAKRPLRPNHEAEQRKDLPVVPERLA